MPVRGPACGNAQGTPFRPDWPPREAENGRIRPHFRAAVTLVEKWADASAAPRRLLLHASQRQKRQDHNGVAARGRRRVLMVEVGVVDGRSSGRCGRGLHCEPPGQGRGSGELEL